MQLRRLVQVLSKHIEIWITLSYGLIVSIISLYHTIYSEWGGVMQVFVGREMLSGQGYRGWSSHFWPPLFSL